MAPEARKAEIGMVIPAAPTLRLRQGEELRGRKQYGELGPRKSAGGRGVQRGRGTVGCWRQRRQHRLESKAEFERDKGRSSCVEVKIGLMQAALILWAPG